MSGKIAFFPRNDRLYGLKCKKRFSENALEVTMPQKNSVRAVRWGKGLLAVAVWLGVLWKTYLWAGPDDVSPAMMTFLLGFVSLLVLPVIALPLCSKRPWRWLGVYAVIWAAVYWGVPWALRAGGTLFSEEVSPDGRFVVECYSVPRNPVTTVFYNHDGSFFVKAFDRKSGKYFFVSDITDWRVETEISWPSGDDREVTVGKYGIDSDAVSFRLPE